MNIAVRQNPADYSIRQMTRTQTSTGDHQISWNFNRATHFLMVIHPAKTVCDLEEDIVPWLEENGKELLEKRRVSQDGVLWIAVQEREFRAKKNKYILPRTSITAGIPYRIVVYPCQIQDEEWDVYTVQGDANVQVIPVPILVEVDYKRSLFAKNQQCRFRAKFDVNRLEGVLKYKPSCSRCQFPVSVESMKASRDGWLSVWLPKGEELNIMVASEYKEYYNIKIAED